jgi:hypothetical protein
VKKNGVYLIFPGTRAELRGPAPNPPNQVGRLCDDITAADINDRLDVVGAAAFKKLKGNVPTASNSDAWLASKERLDTLPSLQVACDLHRAGFVRYRRCRLARRYSLLRNRLLSRCLSSRCLLGSSVLRDHFFR